MLRCGLVDLLAGKRTVNLIVDVACERFAGKNTGKNESENMANHCFHRARNMINGRIRNQG